MSFEFEQALRRKCQQNPNLSVLASQWDYDKQLVADALQVVGLTFPHYSRHDATHSNTILIQLARILGPARIDRLSATDIWMLLEAAYHHDIGMVVTTEQAKKWWESTDFSAFLNGIHTGSDLDLRKAAGILADGSRAGELGPDWSFQVARAHTLVFAEYARRQHPLNAERIVRDPSQIGLASPRTTLIPRRLFDVIARVCAHHGRKFEEIKNLPFRESGLGIDDAHPRFIACMLRLGDLLDLDNNRFCPVMVRSMGELPASSLAHFEKHAAVTRLEVSTTLVEVEAECPDYESYEVTEQWFSWLREELKDQMANWSEIAPSPDFGALPSLGRISARLKGRIPLEPGRRPRFEVDRESMVSLVRGVNIYDDPFSCIREVLQNAVDATLLRLWKEKWSIKPRTELEQLEPKSLREALKVYPIRIHCERSAPPIPGAGATADKVRWYVTIEDAGTGISLDDLYHVQRIGGSKRNHDRQRMIREMPEWMQPSGIFGIGLQSVFLFTDTVTLTTRHHEARDSLLKIELRNGGGKEGVSDGMSIEKLGVNEERALRAGTRVSFPLDVDRLPQWPLRGGTESDRVVKEFDPVIHEEIPYEIACVKDQARQFAETCFCPIEMDGEPLSRRESTTRKYCFDRQSGLEISIDPVLKDSATLHVFYRGAPVPKALFHWSLLNIQCDVHAGRADSLLRLDRRELTDEGRSFVWNRLEDALKRQVPGIMQELRARGSSGELRVASLYAYLEKLPSATESSGNEWEELTIESNVPGQSGPKAVRLGEVVSLPRVCLREFADGVGQPMIKITEMSDQEVSIDVHPEYRGRKEYWLWCLLTRAFGGVMLKNAGPVFPGGEPQWMTYVFEKGKQESTLAEEGLRYVLRRATENRARLLLRATIPCPHGYDALIHDTKKEELSFVRWVEYGLVPRMLCPFVADQNVIRIPHLGKFVEWTVKNAGGGSRSHKEVAEALLKFIQNADQLMEDEWRDRRGYVLADVERELGHWLRG